MNAKQKFIERVTRLEIRYKGAGYKHVESYLMPRALMVRLRDEMVGPPFRKYRKTQRDTMPLFDGR